MVEKVSIKFSEKSKDFLIKLGNNINSNTTNAPLSLNSVLNIVTEYNKDNIIEYQKLVKWGKEHIKVEHKK